MNVKKRQVWAVAGLVVVSAIASSLITTAAEAAYNPSAQDAMGHLQAALSDMQSVSYMPAGGHFSAARGLIKQAIEQVNAGMEY